MKRIKTNSYKSEENNGNNRILNALRLYNMFPAFFFVHFPEYFPPVKVDTQYATKMFIFDHDFTYKPSTAEIKLYFYPELISFARPLPPGNPTVRAYIGVAGEHTKEKKFPAQKNMFGRSCAAASYIEVFVYGQSAKTTNFSRGVAEVNANLTTEPEVFVDLAIGDSFILRKEGSFSELHDHSIFGDVIKISGITQDTTLVVKSRVVVLGTQPGESEERLMHGCHLGFYPATSRETNYHITPELIDRVYALKRGNDDLLYKPLTSPLTQLFDHLPLDYKNEVTPEEIIFPNVNFGQRRIE